MEKTESLAHFDENHGKDEEQNEEADEPPEAGDSMWNRVARAELFFDIAVVIKFLVIGKIKATGFGGFGPAGFFARAAFRTGFCVARNFRATVGANFWSDCHFKKREGRHDTRRIDCGAQPPTPAY